MRAGGPYRHSIAKSAAALAAGPSPIFSLESVRLITPLTPFFLEPTA